MKAGRQKFPSLPGQMGERKSAGDGKNVGKKKFSNKFIRGRSNFL
jgi:hypothetical protein